MREVATVFFGKNERTVDYKGRLTIPTHLLTASDESDWSRLVVVKADPPCLYVYDFAGWRTILGAARETLDDDEQRLFMQKLEDSHVTEIDSLKRITIPSTLLAHAAIDKRVVVVGLLSRLELWNPDSWEKHLGGLQDVEIPTIEDLSRARIHEVS
jgi:MraZ protein